MRPFGVLGSPRWLVVGLAAFAAAAPVSQNAAGAAPDAAAANVLQALRADIEEILRSATGRWRTSRWSILAVSLDRGDTLFAANPGEALAPASNMKLLTSAAAIEQLGPDFRYRTFLLSSAPVTDGRLEGDLILYGTGDPGISGRFQGSGTSVFEAFADSLASLGVFVVQGDVVGDGSYFSGPLWAEGWSATDLNDWFAAPSTALALNENVFTVRVRPGPADGPPEVLTVPDGAGVPILNDARVGIGPALTVRREHPTLPIVVQGAIQPGGREVWRQMTVPDPAHFAASVLRAVLEERGIRVLGIVRAAHDPSHSQVTGRRLWAPALDARRTPRPLASHVSPPLFEYLSVVNKRSHNLLSDQVLKTLGRVVVGEGSFEGGARAIERFLAGSVGLETSALAIYDGSGLSHLNRVSASDFISLVAWMAREGDWTTLWETLPEAGSPQGLRRMYRTAAAGNLRAKTGTIENVSALSGMVRAANGERIAFSIIANHVPSTGGAKTVEDRIGSRLASFERPSSGAGAPVVASVLPPGALTGGETPGAVAGPALDGSMEVTPAESGDVPFDAEMEQRGRHRVRPGENLSVIARRYGVSLDAILEANPAVRPHRLRPGAWVEIPAAGPRR